MNYMMKCAETECYNPHNFQMIQKHKHTQRGKKYRANMPKQKKY